MRRRLLLLLLPLCSALLCVLVLEVAVRLLTRCDADGNCRFRDTRLKPHRLPIRRVEEQVAAYLGSEKSALIYDAELGWNQRPGVANHNAHGFITTAAEVAREPVPGRMRIALFGDSFTQGNYRFGWWRVLEEQLRAAGVEAEVLNFGVGGYGMDQAYLRWKKEGAAWRPHVVVFGFFADDCYRNVNLLRLVRDPDSGIPFMKPRLVLEGDGLRLINSPTPAPARIADILRDFERWPLARYEAFFSPADASFRGWRRSRLLALAEAKAVLINDAARAEEFYRVGGGSAQLALRIIREMRQEAEAAGARFVVVHQPGLVDLAALRKAGRLPYEGLYEESKREHAVVQPEGALLEASEGRPLREFFHDGHYKAEFNAVVGRAVAELLRHPEPR